MHKRLRKHDLNAPKRRRGRNPELIRRRDLKLLMRFHEETEVRRRRFDDVVTQLSWDEFFISEDRVWLIIRQNLPTLDKIAKGENIELEMQSHDRNQLDLFK